MRTLRPDGLHVVDDELWVVDATQPVAVVLGDEPRIVSWPGLPQAPIAERPWSFPTAMAGGSSLWVQEACGEPVGRVTGEGLVEVHYAAGMRLLAAGPDCVWLAPPPNEQNVLTDADLRRHGATPGQRDGHVPLDLGFALPGSLTRIGADGAVEPVSTPGAVRWARTDSDALYVEVETGEATLRELGDDSYDAEPATRWLRLAWVDLPPADLPDEDGVDVTDLPGDSPPGGTRVDTYVTLDDDEGVLRHEGLAWRADLTAYPEPPVPDGDGDSFGWFAYAPPSGQWFDDRSADAIRAATAEAATAFDTSAFDTPAVDASEGAPETPARQPRPFVVEARDDGDDLVARTEFADATISAMAAWGPGVVVLVHREATPTEVVALAANEDPQTLFIADLDITAHCRTLVPRPVETDSYLRQMPTMHPCPRSRGIGDARTRVVGEWPSAELEWSFTHPSRPGLRLRRRFALFDETGRIDEDGLEYADIHLMEDIETGGVPPAHRAVDGVLDLPSPS